MTELVYLEDTYLFEHDASVIDFGSDDKGQYCLLDKTVFYPQGGGQPSDTGTITIGEKTIPVTFVGYVDGKVRHYGDFSAVSDTVGQAAKLSVNKSRRLLNAKAHTAGHLIQCVVEEIDPALKAVKGYHFPDGSYVEFSGTSTMDAQERIEKANVKLKEIVEQKVNNSTRLVSKDELSKLCPNLPYDVPADKPTRVMSIGEYAPVPCGGTHLSSIGELENVEISKIKKKKGMTKVSYTFV